MADMNPQVALGGCLARVFSLFGFFLIGTGIFATVRNFDAPGGGLAFAGSLLPGLALVAVGRAIKRRINQVAVESMANTDSRPPIPTQRPRETSPQPTLPTRATQPPARPIPVEIAEILEKDPPDEHLGHIEEIALDDFKPGRPLSSDERIRLAREKYNKKPD